MNHNLQFDHVITCDFQDSRQLQTVYLNLPEKGRLELTCSVADLETILQELTKIGFFGLRIIVSEIASPFARISAFKGKSGPCYDTGRTATYTGAAMAALDDNGHLLMGPTRVCEKTAAIYRSKIYHHVVNISGPEAKLYSRLKSNPEPFDCDNYEENVRLLASSLTSENKSIERKIIIFYPGPFLLLILADGAIIRRGQATYIAQTYINKLKKLDKCIVFPSMQHIQAVSAHYFQNIYKAKGSIGLIETENITSTIRRSDTINLRSLSRTSHRMRRRLQKVISGKENYFILTGSDPWDIYGCCPSKEIGAANRLVESGILSSWQASKHQDSCPSTVYAFNQEIQDTDGKLSFTENTILRKQVLNHIIRNQSPWKKNTIIFLRTVLLLFVVVSIIFVVKGAPQLTDVPSATLSKNHVENNNIVIVYVAHFGISCEVCEKIKSLTQRTLNQYFADYLNSGNLRYETINIDDPKNASTVNFFNLYSNGVIFAHEENGIMRDHKVIKDRIWFLSHSDTEFTKMIREELIHFMNKND